MMQAQKQVQQFDELMRRTKEKHKMIHQLCIQQINTDTSRNIQPTENKIDELTTILVEPFKTAISSTEICDSTDAYGRNMARLQTSRSILFESAIEIKEIGEEDDNNDDDDDDDDDEDNNNNNNNEVK
ncbi:Uncharacterized protein BM_BM10028 [Brugia malayi]|uniref:Uncharacterized protein n=2 Tax=Brugia malayi TaxID=6279 RepID=A0A4E9EY57_BRUMA|nr:Uncharacterized protein BM_BM10028 [Brugia malayi]VIO89373.1 Uncharacterized protein BM_BM10028 [Brugia malayi]